MMPPRELPEEDPSRTGWEGNAGAPAAEPSPDTQDAIGAETANPDVTDAEVADGDTAVDDTADAGAPAGTLAGDGTAGDTAVDAVAGGMWSEIQAMFVDDPRGSVTQAAGMVDEAVEAFITTVRERQATLASSWQVQGTDTERLRAAFQEYRSFWTSVTELSQSA